MEHTPSIIGGYKDCEKAVSSANVEAVDSASSSSAARIRPGMWALQARICCPVLIVATVLLFFAAICRHLSPLLEPIQDPLPKLHTPTLLSRSHSPRTQAHAPALLSDAVVESKASAGCSSPQNVSIATTTVVALGNRTYRLYFPVNYKFDEPAPVVLSYHGGTRTALRQEQLDLLTTTYFNRDYIVVYPESINGTWQGVPGVTTDDTGFTTRILNELEERYCIDTNRIYATGKSQGGGFVGKLACDATLSKRIAAFAPVSGAHYVSDYGSTCDPWTVVIQPCNPGRTNIPILNFHGLNDSTIRYWGGERKDGCLPAIPHWTQTWARRDGLELTNTSSSVPGASSGSSAVMYEFGSGWQKGMVTHIMDGTNIGHDWPSTLPNNDNTDDTGFSNPSTFNASSIILSYFATHPLGWGVS